MNKFISPVCLLIMLYPAHDSTAGPSAQDTESVTTESAVESAPAALDRSLPPKVSEVLTRMAEFLESTLIFTGSAVFANDELQTDGHVLEVGGTFDLSIHAPLRAKMAIRDQTGAISLVILDGETLSIGVDMNNQFYYDSIKQPGDITASLDFLAEDLGVPRVLQGIMSANVLAMFADVSSGNYVGEATIGGLLCDHLLLHTDTQDIQLWVTQGDQPAPLKYLKTYKESQGQLRVSIQFSNWDFSPDMPADLFTLPLPENAERFDFFQYAPENGAE